MNELIDLGQEFFRSFASKVLNFSFILFCVAGCSLFLNRSNIMKLLISFELMVLAIIFNFTICASIHQDIRAQVFVFFIFIVAACESAIGLAIFFLFFRKKETVALDEARSLKG